jgi:16S rRNA (uracil1498-N3)-methyltransferase
MLVRMPPDTKNRAMRTLLVDAPLLPGELTLSSEEARHGLQVLRLRPGDAVRIADGHGRSAPATVCPAPRGVLTVLVQEVQTSEPGPMAALTVACAVPKGDRFDDLVRGLTELGVGRILPLVCQRSVREPMNLQRQERVACEALKQCRRGWLPQIGPLMDIPTLAASSQVLIILDREGAAPRCGQPAATTLVVGPEGGLAPDELDLLVAVGAQKVRLGRHVLRIETAALAAAAVWSAAWEVSAS